MIRTAVDSSILLDVLIANSAHGEASFRMLERCWDEGCLLACGVVWAEVRPYFSSEADLYRVTEKIGLGFEPMTQEAALMAGEIWRRYRSKKGRRDRMIPDFLIAAHAKLQADRLLTRDRGFYREYFPDVAVLLPD